MDCSPPSSSVHGIFQAKVLEWGAIAFSRKWKTRVKKLAENSTFRKQRSWHHFMANRWRNNGNSGWLYFGGLQNHCRWWLQPWNKKMLTPWKKNYDQPRQDIKKQRDITLPTKIRLVKAMVFPVVMYGCENWTIKKAEHWRINAFELWCWVRLLRIAWTARRSYWSILKEISPECSLEGLMVKLKL